MINNFIALSFNCDDYPTPLEADKAVRVLMNRYRALPKYIAKKHLGAAMKRVLARGVPILRSVTPPVGTKRGRRKKGFKTRSTGELRRSVTVRTGMTGKNDDFDMFVWGCLGYRYNGQNRKPIWMQYGTSGGTSGYNMIGQAMKIMGPVSAAELANAMATALEKANKIGRAHV